MKVSRVAVQFGLVLATACGCVMALAQPAVAPVMKPHRLPTLGSGSIGHLPYAPPPGSVPNPTRVAAPFRPIRDIAKSAAKSWDKKAWISTGGIERRHYWLARPLDHDWQNRLASLRLERILGWRLRRLDELVWLGQGWRFMYDESTTQPSTRPDIVAAAPLLIETVRPHQLALRVKALGVLTSLQFSGDQFHKLRGALDQMSDAGQVVDADVVDNDLEAAPNCLGALDKVYWDLVLRNDDRAVADQQTLLQLEDKNQFSVDPTVVVTDAARAQAQNIYDLMTPGQIAAYVAQRGEIVPDVSDLLMAGLDECRGLSDADFAEFSHSLAERVAVLTTGLSVEANESLMQVIGDMLKQARSLPDDQFAARKTDLQRQADRIAAACFPTDLIAHAIQWDLACFLSNPQAKGMTLIRARQMGAS